MKTLNKSELCRLAEGSLKVFLILKVVVPLFSEIFSSRQVANNSFFSNQSNALIQLQTVDCFLRGRLAQLAFLHLGLPKAAN